MDARLKQLGLAQSDLAKQLETDYEVFRLSRNASKSIACFLFFFAAFSGGEVESTSRLDRRLR